MSMSTSFRRDIIGRFYKVLEETTTASWAARLAAYVPSNQESEIYRWFGMAPTMRQWVGGRQGKKLREFGQTVTNIPYEATLEIMEEEIRRDKTQQILMRAGEMGTRTATHWQELLSTLITAAEATACYDGQYFFDTDHSEGDSGTQSNKLSYAAATGTTPTVAEFEGAVIQALQAMMGFKDDTGKPFHNNPRNFMVMVPVAHWGTAVKALTLPVIVDGSASRTNSLPTLGINFEIVVNPRLTGDKFWFYRTDDANIRPFIMQEEYVPRMREKDDTFDNRRFIFGVDTSRAVAYAWWQDAILTTFT